MDVITKYINNSKLNMKNIIKYLDENIEYINNNIEINDELLTDIINIYYDKYYLNNNIDYEIINNYININKNINVKLKKILLSIIEYYKNLNDTNIIKEKEESILYLDILIYLAMKIYETDYKSIDEPKKIEKQINNIIDNFAKIRFKKDKNLNKLILNIKDNVIYNNYFNSKLNAFNRKESFNKFIKINKDENLYKVLYDYKVNELNNYNIKDINIVKEKINIDEEMNKISYDLMYFTNFKILNNNKKNKFLFPITKNSFKNNYEYYFNERNEKILNNIKFVIDYKEIENDYEFVNLVNEKELDIYIDVTKTFETNNYNLFMSLKNIIVSEDFLSKNEKYKEIWKDMEINFIIKNIDNNIMLEKDLLKKKEV